MTNETGVDKRILDACAHCGLTRVRYAELEGTWGRSDPANWRRAVYWRPGFAERYAVTYDSGQGVAGHWVATADEVLDVMAREGWLRRVSPDHPLT